MNEHTDIEFLIVDYFCKLIEDTYKDDAQGFTQAEREAIDMCLTLAFDEWTKKRFIGGNDETEE